VSANIAKDAKAIQRAVAMDGLSFLLSRLSTAPQNRVAMEHAVTPATAGVQKAFADLDSGYRRNDERGILDALLRGTVQECGMS
jgi:hypothetical protein